MVAGQYFQTLPMTPASEEDAIKVLEGFKGRYEDFHGVTYAEDALTNAVYYAASCMKGRSLPRVAVDLMDEAGALVKMRQATAPEEIRDVQNRIGFIAQRLKQAVANHEFEKARFYSNEERKEREQLAELARKYKVEDSPRAATRDDIENTVARWTGMSVAAVRQSRAGDAQEQKNTEL